MQDNERITLSVCVSCRKCVVVGNGNNEEIGGDSPTRPTYQLGLLAPVSHLGRVGTIINHIVVSADITKERLRCRHAGDVTLCFRSSAVDLVGWTDEVDCDSSRKFLEWINISLADIVKPFWPWKICPHSVTKEACYCIFIELYFILSCMLYHIIEWIMWKYISMKAFLR